MLLEFGGKGHETESGDRPEQRAASNRSPAVISRALQEACRQGADDQSENVREERLTGRDVFLSCFVRTGRITRKKIPENIKSD